MGNRIKAEITGGEEIDKLLAELPSELRQRMLPKALRAGAKPIQKAARSKLPNPGYPGDKDPDVSLKRWILIKVKVYDSAVVVVVGPTYNMKHSHLVEFGHRIVMKLKLGGGDGTKVQVGFVAPHPYMRSSIDETESQRHPMIVNRIKKEIRDFHAKFKGTA